MGPEKYIGSQQINAFESKNNVTANRKKERPPKKRTAKKSGMTLSNAI